MREKKKKKWIHTIHIQIIKSVLMLLLVVFLAMFPKETVYATQVELEGIIYELDEGSKTAVISGYNDPSANLVISSTIVNNDEEYTVISIKESAFINCTKIVSISIPESVTYIGKKAFSDCTGLTTVKIPSSITRIYDRTFYNCNSLTDFAIPNQVTYIGNYAFYQCSSLETVNIPNNVTVLGNYAYSGCVNLQNLTLSNQIKLIDSYTFYNCKKLTKVVITDKVTTIGSRAFSNCTNLSDITLPDGLQNIGSYAFNGCEKLSEISIPDSVTNIGNFAFYGCGLMHVRIPSYVTVINERVFHNCTQLKSVEIPTTVSTISKSAFANTGLVNIEIPNSVTSIGETAFSKCDSLNTIIFPSGISTIGKDTLSLCDNLNEVYYPSGVSVDNIGLNIGGNKTSIISYTINDDDTVSFLVENIADTSIRLNLPSSIEGKRVSSVRCANNVNKIEVSASKPSGTMTAGCSYQTVSDIELPENWKWKDADKDKDITGDNVVTATAFYDVLEREIYSDAEITVLISGQHIGQTSIKDAKESSCKESGYTGDTWCLTCNEKIRDGSIIPVTNTHTYDAGVVTTQATFTDTGIKTYSCIICENHTKTEEIPVLTATSQTIEITCFDGKVSDLILPANWQWKPEDQDKEWGTVSSFTVVALYEGDDKDNYSTTEVIINITVEHTGETKIKDPKETSCKEVGYTGDTWCLDCNKIIVEGETIEKINTHTYNDGVITKAPTVEEQGIKTYICTVCQSTKTENLPKLQAPPNQEIKEENTTDNNPGDQIVTETIPEEEINKEPEDVASEEETNKESVSTEDREGDGDESLEKESNDKVDDESVNGNNNESNNVMAEENEKDFNSGILFVVLPVIALVGAGGVFLAFRFKKIA